MDITKPGKLLANVIRSRNEPITFQDLHYVAYHCGLVRNPIDLANLLEELDTAGQLAVDEAGAYTVAE